jgi:tRNA A37 methylthiotransferase MiaB
MKYLFSRYFLLKLRKYYHFRAIFTEPYAPRQAVPAKRDRQLETEADSKRYGRTQLITAQQICQATKSSACRGTACRAPTLVLDEIVFMLFDIKKFAGVNNGA